MDPAFSYRPANASDAPAMCETAALGFAGYAAFAPRGWRPPREPSDVEKLTERMSLARAVAWVAEHDGAPAGHVLLIPASESRDPVADPRLAHVMHVFVREPYWGTGVASELLRLLLDGARSEDFSSARLFTPADQMRARRFYEREGWTLSGDWADETLGLGVVEYRKAPL
jgi:GNAT superfamily N-acetyltransferase